MPAQQCVRLILLGFLVPGCRRARCAGSVEESAYDDDDRRFRRLVPESKRRCCVVRSVGASRWYALLLDRGGEFIERCREAQELVSGFDAELRPRGPTSSKSTDLYCPSTMQRFF